MKIIFSFLLAFLCFTVSAQVKIVVLGSSTAQGYGADPYFPFPDTDSGWVNRLRLSYNKNTNDGLDTTVVNLAVGGYTTYHVMPTNYTPPPNRPAPDPLHNVTYAISLDPDVIIINLPSNDLSLGFSKAEVMNNFRFLYQTITAAGINAFITTTQPRDFSPNYVLMEYQRDLKDSIQNNFGYFSINFWDDLVATSPPNSIRPEVAYGDGIHINNLGHFLVYERVAAKNLFIVNTILPLYLKSFNATVDGKKTRISWETSQEDPNTVFVLERGTNSTDFKTLTNISGVSTSGSSYNYIDADPAQGYSYYRLKIQGNSGIKYSETRQVHHSSSGFFIEKVRVTASSMTIDLQSEINGNLQVYLISSSGTRMEMKEQKLSAPATQIILNVGQLPAGVYYLVLSAGNESVSKPVFLMK
jgi:lysophospholipase L1-like esterase